MSGQIFDKFFLFSVNERAHLRVAEILHLEPLREDRPRAPLGVGFRGWGSGFVCVCVCVYVCVCVCVCVCACVYVCECMCARCFSRVTPLISSSNPSEDRPRAPLGVGFRGWGLGFVVLCLLLETGGLGFVV